MSHAAGRPVRAALTMDALAKLQRAKDELANSPQGAAHATQRACIGSSVAVSPACSQLPAAQPQSAGNAFAAGFGTASPSQPAVIQQPQASPFAADAFAVGFGAAAPLDQPQPGQPHSAFGGDTFAVGFGAAPADQPA
eukprot:460152-Prymnesium_polylepis.1